MPKIKKLIKEENELRLEQFFSETRKIAKQLDSGTLPLGIYHLKTKLLESIKTKNKK